MSEENIIKIDGTIIKNLTIKTQEMSSTKVGKKLLIMIQV
jgi:hypothetical protein